MTECTQSQFGFQRLCPRKIAVDFEGGHLTTEGGIPLIGELDRRLKLTERFGQCFTDYRDPRFTEFSVLDLLRQRIYGLVAGYEDLNDHQDLRRDPCLAATVGREDPSGQDRRDEDQKGHPLAGKSTLNRLELAVAKHPDSAPEQGSKHKIFLQEQRWEQLLIEVGVELLEPESSEVILDFDATDDPVHGEQEARFFHGYYREYCYMPLYCFAGAIPLVAQLRPSDQDASAGTVEALEKIVPRLRERFGPELRIIVRADSGFCRESIMRWCETHGVFYCLGLAKNQRLRQVLAKTMWKASERVGVEGPRAKVFTEFRYRTKKSWSRSRRVIAKAEITEKGSNPRFVVTNLCGAEERFRAARLYTQLYCGRGDMENRIKEQQLHLFADRTSTHYFSSNQFRLWFSTLAYVLLQQLRAVALAGTELAKASCATIRLRLLKVAGLVRLSVRRVWIQLSSAYVSKRAFQIAYHRLIDLPSG